MKIFRPKIKILHFWVIFWVFYFSIIFFRQWGGNYIFRESFPGAIDRTFQNVALRRTFFFSAQRLVARTTILFIHRPTSPMPSTTPYDQRLSIPDRSARPALAYMSPSPSGPSSESVLWSSWRMSKLARPLMQVLSCRLSSMAEYVFPTLGVSFHGFCSAYDAQTNIYC